MNNWIGAATLQLGFQIVPKPPEPPEPPKTEAEKAAFQRAIRDETKPNQ